LGGNEFLRTVSAIGQSVDDQLVYNGFRDLFEGRPVGVNAVGADVVGGQGVRIKEEVFLTGAGLDGFHRSLLGGAGSVGLNGLHSGTGPTLPRIGELSLVCLGYVARGAADPQISRVTVRLL
jgi:hypothetical protein